MVAAHALLKRILREPPPPSSVGPCCTIERFIVEHAPLRVA